MNTAEATITNDPASNKAKAKKAVLFSLGTLALGTLAFFGIKHFKKPKNESNDNSDETTDSKNYQIPVQTNAGAKPDPGSRPATTGATFPLNLRAKGSKVLELQHALMRTYGSGIFPKHGADGSFGTELSDFLRSKGYGVPLQESDFKKITQEQKPEAATPLLIFDPAAIAKGIYSAILAKDHSALLTLLKAITNTTTYSSVSEQLKLYWINGVHQNLVNAALSSFPEKSQKEATKNALKKMGLKENIATGVWSLK